MNQPRKRFGQHFLHDPQVIERIVEAIGTDPADTMVEIGPGQGALTSALLARNPALHVVEIDRDLATSLPLRMGHPAELKVHTEDALRFDFSSISKTELRIVGNLPYNISTPLLFHLLEQRDAIRDMHFMLQKEVGDRIVAEPGNKQYGRLTVMLRTYLGVKRLFDVGPGAFKPPPRVWSCVLRLYPRKSAQYPKDPALFTQLVRQVFSLRRKTLANGVKQWLTANELEEMGIDPRIRGEMLAPEVFVALSDAISKRTIEGDKLSSVK